MMQHTNAHVNPNNVPKQSRTYPTLKKAEESEHQPMLIDLKNKVKTITSLNNPNNRNFRLNNDLHVHNQKLAYDNTDKQKLKLEEEEKPQSIPQSQNYSKTLNSNNELNQCNKGDNNLKSDKFNNSSNENARNSINNNVYSKNQNNYSGKQKSDKSSTNNEAPYASSSGSNLNKNFKANTTEYALNSSNNTSNHNINSFSLRQNKVSGHTYTKLAERMKSGEKKIYNNNSNKIPNYVKNKTDPYGKFTSEIFNNLNNHLNQNRNSGDNFSNKEYNDKENYPVNYNSNQNSAFGSSNNNFNQNPINSAAYCEKKDEICKGLNKEKEPEKNIGREVSPKSIDSKINKNDETNMQIEKLDPAFNSLAEADQNGSFNKSESSRNKNSTMTDINFNTNKALDSIINQNNNNNCLEKDLINNYNPILVTNEIANLKRFEEENIVEPPVQKLDYSVTDDQANQKQKAFKANQNENFSSNPDDFGNPNIVFYEKNNTNFSVRGDNQNSNYHSLHNLNTNFNPTDNCQSTHHIKTNHSKALLTESKYAQYDTQQLCYELVKEYAHLKIDKDEEFMRRMLFDIFKRQTKEERLEKLLEKNKVKIHEHERIKTFNRLIEDANRRMEAQDQMEEMKMKIETANVNNKKYKIEEWEEIYNNRFLRHQKHREQWIEERQNEKKRQEELHEQELVELCKTIKKPKEEIENFVQRMHNEAERRQFKFETKRHQNSENKINIDDFISRANLDFHPKSPNQANSRASQNKKHKQTNYQFQSDMSGNENSEDEKKFLSKLKELKEKNLSNSPAARKSPQRQLYTNETALIKESANEGELEENSTYDGNYTNNHNKEKLKILDNRNNQRLSRENVNNSKNNNNYTEKNLSVNKYSDGNYNTEINNRRFEIDPSENKRNIFNNVYRNTPMNNRKPDKSASSKKHKSKNNDPINVYPAYLKNMQEFEQRNFLMEEDDELKEIRGGYKMNLQKRAFSKNSHGNTTNKMHSKLKHIPDHLATRLVDDILSAKFSKD